MTYGCRVWSDYRRATPHPPGARSAADRSVAAACAVCSADHPQQGGPTTQAPNHQDRSSDKMSSERDGNRRTSRVAQWELRLDQRRPLPEVIEEKLRELIDNGVLPEGERLPNEPELARRMAVARSSVRTAL